MGPGKLWVIFYKLQVRSTAVDMIRLFFICTYSIYQSWYIILSILWKVYLARLSNKGYNLGSTHLLV